VQVAILIPTYRTEFNHYEINSILRVIKLYQNKFDIFFICPENIKNRLNNFNINVESFPNIFFSNHSYYNKLCMDKILYNRFKKYEYILISQIDSLILDDKLKYWCEHNISYIGAPSYHKKLFSKKPKSPKFFCNGGFSLRKVEDFVNLLDSDSIYLQNIDLKIINQICFRGYFFKFMKLLIKSVYFRNKNYFIRNFFLNEDVFYTYFAKLFYNKFKVPKDTKQCAYFALSEGVEYYIEKYNQIPFGIHGYNKKIDLLLKKRKFI
tara:strand:+ start:1211 stop:2005 length:795 start_codon:yes stop_codon:yes gene_type:complete